MSDLFYPTVKKGKSVGGRNTLNFFQLLSLLCLITYEHLKV